MTIGPETGLVDVAFEVRTALMKSGSTAVLTGGSAAQFHAPEVCSSFVGIDLELIRRWSRREGATERFVEFEQRWT